MKTKRVIGIAIGVVAVFYAIAPYYAGVLEIAPRSGPVLWAREWHTALYAIGCENYNGYKPREGLERIFLRRPFFYGLPERPYPKEKRLEILEERLNGRDPETVEDFFIKWAIRTEAWISEQEESGQYSTFDRRRKIRIRENLGD